MQIRDNNTGEIIVKTKHDVVLTGSLTADAEKWLSTVRNALSSVA